MHIKKYIHEKLQSSKINITDSCQENYISPPSINEILSEFLISDIDYYNVLAISKNDDYELHLIRSSDLGFVNNYFEDSFGAW